MDIPQFYHFYVNIWIRVHWHFISNLFSSQPFSFLIFVDIFLQKKIFLRSELTLNPTKIISDDVKTKEFLLPHSGAVQKWRHGLRGERVLRILTHLYWNLITYYLNRDDGGCVKSFVLHSFFIYKELCS